MLNKILAYLLIAVLPLVALVDSEMSSFFQQLPIYGLAIVLFVIGAWRLLRQRELVSAVAVVASLVLTFCFANGVFKSEIIASTHNHGGDMTDFQGELILRKNHNCEIRQSTIFDHYRYQGTYTICKNIIFIKGCGEYVKAFDTISINKKIYLVFKDK